MSDTIPTIETADAAELGEELLQRLGDSEADRNLATALNKWLSLRVRDLVRKQLHG